MFDYRAAVMETVAEISERRMYIKKLERQGAY